MTATPIITPLWRRWFFAHTRALSGEWAEDGKVMRFAIRRARWAPSVGGGVHLIIGPWVLTLGRLA